MLIILLLLLIAWAVANETYRRGLWEFKSLSLKRKATTEPEKNQGDKPVEKKTDEKKKEKDDKKGPKKLGPAMTFFLSVGVWIGVWVAIWLLTPDLWGWLKANPETFGGINVIVLLLVGIGFLPIQRMFKGLFVIGVIMLLITSSTLRGPAWSAYHEVATKTSQVKELTKFKTAGRAEYHSTQPSAEALDELAGKVVAPADGSWSAEIPTPQYFNGNVNSTAPVKAQILNGQGVVVREIADNSQPGVRFDNLPANPRFRFASITGEAVTVTVTK